jgi:hypothetical protein
MTGRNRYDRDWPSRHRPAHRGDRYTRDYDRAGRDRRDCDGANPRARASGGYARESGYAAQEYHRPPRHSAPPLYSDEFRHPRPSAAEREADALWAAPSHRRRREPRGPWERGWRPHGWWHAIGPEPRADYDWAYEARRPERYGWTGETGRG